MKKIILFLVPVFCFGQIRNVQVNASNNLTQPSAGINFTSGQTLTASSGATINFSSATVTLPSTAAIAPPSSPTEGDLLVYHSSAWGKLSTGTSGYVLTSNGAASLPSYQVVTALTNPMTATGDLIVGGTSGAPTRLAAGTSGYVLTSTGTSTAPSWQAAGGGGSIGGSTGSTDTALLRANGTGGSTVQSSNVTLASSGTEFVFSGASGLTSSGSNHAVTLTPTGTGAVVINNSAPTLGYPVTLSSNINTLTLQPSTSNSDNQVNIAPSGSAGNSNIILYHNSDVTASDQAFGFGGGFVGAISNTWNFGAYVIAGATTTSWPITFLTSNGSGRHQVLTLNPNASIQLNGYGAGALSTDSSGNVTATSDARLKNIQGPFGRGLFDILKLHPVLYKWNQASGNETETTYAGFTAQGVQSAIPEAVGEMKNGFLTLQDRPIIAALVNANRDLYDMIKALAGAIVLLAVIVGIIVCRK